MSFGDDLRKLVEKRQGDVRQVVRTVALDLLDGVIDKTPVDTGRLAGNWRVGLGSPDLDKSDAGNPGAADRARLRGENTVAQWTQGPIYITNALPYAKTVEFGLYPNPPKRGSWDKRRHEWMVKSRGGYSIQAPQGMVRLTVQQFSEALRRAVASVK